MAGGQIQNPSSFPIQLLVNYWEIQPSQIGTKLDRLLSAGISHIVSFVPWQAVESDISHTLPRFIQALSERKMTVSLIVTPELGVHFTSSGLPKDVMGRPDALVQHFQKGPVQVSLAPNSFQLPSLLSSEFTKRYYSFLSRIDNMLWDLEKNQGRPLDHVTLVLSGSFWKNYRSPVASCRNAFSAPAGDYSSNASIHYRQRLEEYYSQSEFNDPTPMASNRWKTQPMEEVNRRWFYQQSEAVFRNRTMQFARKKAANVQLKEIELFTPEADPSLSYSFFLSAVSGCQSDFEKLSTLVEDASAMGSMAGYGPAASFVHWTSLGGFRSLSDPEKQFLILKSLLLLGSQGGGVLVDEEEWLSLSKNFRGRAEDLARTIERGELTLRTRALYLSPHLWSGPTAFWPTFSKKAGASARKVASVDLALQSPHASLLMVDPAFILSREVIRKLLHWVSAGDRILAIPRSTLYTESARAQLEAATAASKRIEMNLGTRYQILPQGEGKLLIYDIPDAALTQELNSPEWQSFVESILSVADIQSECQVSDGRISLVPLERTDRSIGLFVLNASRRPVAVDLIFGVNVSIADLTAETKGSREDRIPPAKRFALEVPSCGVLPLAVDRVGSGVPRSEQAEADRLSGYTQENARAAASNELPGLDAGLEGGAIWN